MLKLFRRIRQNLVREGNLKRYLIYAVGEILLVVLGILIALQINNLNEKRKERNEEQKILIQLQEEYQNNLQQLDEKIQIRKLLIINSTKILDFIETETNVNPDSLAGLLGSLGLVPTFDPISNDIVNSGKLRLVQNEKLRKMLSSWVSDVIQLKEEEDYWVKMRDETLFPFYIKQGIARDAINEYLNKEAPAIFLPGTRGDIKLFIGKSSKTPSVQEILSNRELEGLLTIIIALNYVGNLQSRILREKILDILSLIDLEISTEQ